MRKTIGLTLLMGGMLMLLGMTSNPSFAAPGNNGDVKVAGISVDSIPNNAPHQDCTFKLEFYNFDLGSADATYTFTLAAPTQSPGSGLLMSDSVAVGGGPLPGFDKLDATATVDLSSSLAGSGATASDQGFHVRLDVTGAGLHGGGSKAKMFWVTGDCGGTLPG